MLVDVDDRARPSSSAGRPKVVLTQRHRRRAPSRAAVPLRSRRRNSAKSALETGGGRSRTARSRPVGRGARCRTRSHRRRLRRVEAAGDRDHVRARSAGAGPGAAGRERWLVAVDHLQQLQHRFVVLMLVRDQHLVGEAGPEDRILRVVEVELVEHLERALANVLHVGAEIVAPQDREFVAVGARVLDRVVDAAEIAVQRFPAPGRLDEPQLLEVGDMAQIPRERTEQRRVDGVELLVAELLDEQESASTRLGEPLRNPLPIGCLRGRRDIASLPIRTPRQA